MPQTATLEAPTARIAVPAPRTEQPKDPNAWVLSLPRTDLALALSLSDLPHTSATAGALNPAGVRQLMAWAAQGTERAGGVLALWQAACQWRTLGRTNTWSTPAGKAFTRQFGSQRRTQHATDWAGKLPTLFEPTTVRISITADTIDLVTALGGLFTDVSGRDHTCEPMTALFQMSRHDARMVAGHFDRTLVPFVRGGYALA